MAIALIWQGDFAIKYGALHLAIVAAQHGKTVSAVNTYRGSNVRLISVRRARTEEAALYES